MIAALGLAACSDNDEPAVVVQDANPANAREAAVYYNSITYAWDKVPGVNQYGYTFRDADGFTLEDGITNATSVTFTDLAINSRYSFELRVYGATGEPSYCTVIESATKPVQQLATPAPTASQQSNRVVLSWPAVEGADWYVYSYAIGDNTITEIAYEPSCSIAGLAPGTHQLTVAAISDNPGYTDSQIATVQAIRTRSEIATVEGTYTCGLMRRNNSWPCTMHIYDDDSYVIDAFYQGEGYNLDFYVDGASVGVYNFASFPDCEYYVMDTGRESVPQVELVGGSGNSTFSGDAASGLMTITSRYSTTTATDQFQWP